MKGMPVKRDAIHAAVAGPLPREHECARSLLLKSPCKVESAKERPQVLAALFESVPASDGNGSQKFGREPGLRFHH